MKCRFYASDCLLLLEKMPFYAYMVKQNYFSPYVFTGKEFFTKYKLFNPLYPA